LRVGDLEPRALARDALAGNLEGGGRAGVEAPLGEAGKLGAPVELALREREPPAGDPHAEHRVAHPGTHLPGRALQVVARGVGQVRGLRRARLALAERLDDEIDHQADGPG
jgi:hypothetical protein